MTLNRHEQLGSAGSVEIFRKKSLTALCLKTCIRCWGVREGWVAVQRGGVCISQMIRANSEGTAISGEHQLPSSLPSHNQLKCVRLPLACQTNIFEMTRGFHVFACFKVCERAVRWLHQGRVKDLQWPKSPGSLPNKLPVALNLQHNTTHSATHMYTHRHGCQSHLKEIGSNNTKTLLSPSSLILFFGSVLPELSFQTYRSFRLSK